MLLYLQLHIFTVSSISNFLKKIFILKLDADECKTCPDVLKGLEKIDTETDNLDITFIKINDPRYARKYGVTKLPSLVYFRKKFPSIYRGKSYLLKKTLVSQLIVKLRAEIF